MTETNETMIDYWNKGWLSSKAKDVLIDKLLNPDARDFKKEQSESMKFTDHDKEKHKKYDERKLASKENKVKENAS